MCMFFNLDNITDIIWAVNAFIDAYSDTDLMVLVWYFQNETCEQFYYYRSTDVLKEPSLQPFVHLGWKCCRFLLELSATFIDFCEAITKAFIQLNVLRIRIDLTALILSFHIKFSHFPHISLTSWLSFLFQQNQHSIFICQVNCNFTCLHTIFMHKTIRIMSANIILVTW